jgi:hypothetical protein
MLTGVFVKENERSDDGDCDSLALYQLVFTNTMTVLVVVSDRDDWRAVPIVQPEVVAFAA